MNITDFSYKFVEDYVFPRDIRTAVSFEIGDGYFEDELAAFLIDAIRTWERRDE